MLEVSSIFVQLIGIMICISNLSILLILIGYLAIYGVQNFEPEHPPNGSFFQSQSIFNSAPEFCFTFHFQIYFLIVLQYLGHRQKVQNSYQVAGATNLSVLAFCLSYCFLCLNTNIVFKDFRQAIEGNFELSTNQILLNVLLLWLTSLQIPFKFFLEKEFLFILYEELKNRSVSSKILETQAQLYSA